MDEDLKFLKNVIITLLSIIMGIMFFVYLIDKNVSCPRFSKNTQLECRYDFWAGGCFVNYEGQWIQSKNLRAGKLK